MLQLTILNGNALYYPVVQEGITWSTERKSSPGSLKFTVLWDEKLKIEEGNVVMLKDGDTGIFYGYIFSKSVPKTGLMSITAYDQLRYFKNKDNYVYSNKSTSELVQMIARDFQLTTGVITDTSYKMTRCESESTLFDIFNNSNDETLRIKKELYVLYDDFGALTLRNVTELRLPILIDEDSAGDYELKSSIDENTYNRIKLTYDNETTGEREQYIAQDSNTIASWGVLQYLEAVDDVSTIPDKLKALLDLYNTKTTTLKVSDCFGDIRVRAGTCVLVHFKIEGKEYYTFMVVNSAKHTFNKDDHKMELDLIGGGISG